jgi:hypothetical protein
MSMQMRTGLAGLVALAWSIAAILIWTAAGGPPPAHACIPQATAAGETRFVVVSADGEPLDEPEGAVTSCRP